ncbi:tyrosine-type recombinase/integrase [Pseudoduganella eburnea]|uniref:Tyrosine-type recombinase/integrase n=1 Tax=Massilia eburnea TaxID=1776165 RepID=A0A6L6QM94_9BURK|nr:site-specific integrase [Massilia eburnea]MTW13429.1 tyrosine-type recombinase/integrase [Massilia eburnea]
MLTDVKLRNLKPGPKAYKVQDRDGLYAMVLVSGVVSFRYNYRVNGRQETLVLGKYGVGGVTLAEAREKLVAAKKLVAEGKSPTQQKRRQKARIAGEETFGEWAERWLSTYRMAESTRDMRRSVYERDLHRPFGKMLLHEITHEELRRVCDAIVARGAPATAVHAREIVMLVFRHAGQRGHEAPNPADKVPPCSIATFQPRDRALSSTEIPWLYEHLEKIQSAPTLRLAVKLLLLTMVRKSELTDATWDEINFTSGVWTIPAQRMKRRNPHNVYLSRQAIDMFIALRTCAAGSPYVLPSRYDADLPISNATLNSVTTSVSRSAREAGRPLADFTPHDLRRTASTLLHEAGYNTDWIEKCLAHEQRGVRAVYNKAEYADQRRAMMQDWADMIDGWVKGA